MDADAQRAARRKAIKADLAEVYTDEEASPPEWVDLLTRIRGATLELSQDVAMHTERFVTEPDIRTALARRERVAGQLRERVERVNALVRRLNLIVPNARFTRGELDAEELLRPLFRTERRPL